MSTSGLVTTDKGNQRDVDAVDVDGTSFYLYTLYTLLELAISY